MSRLKGRNGVFHKVWLFVVVSIYWNTSELTMVEIEGGKKKKKRKTTIQGSVWGKSTAEKININLIQLK